MSKLLPEVKNFLHDSPLKLFIGGDWHEARSGNTFESIDPGTGKRLATIASAEAEDVDAAVDSAQKAFRSSGWANLPNNERAVILHRLADLIDRNCHVIAQLESLDVGKPISQPVSFDIPNCAQTLRYYADLSVYAERRQAIAVSGFEAYTLRSPYGVCAFIIPWNFPFLLLGWGAGPALAAGNTVVIKPAEDTSLSTLYFAGLAREAGVPAGVINVIPGYGHIAGASLASHPAINRLAFTGSPQVGREVAAACGRNLVPVKLELGGKGAALIFPDIDLEKTADTLAKAITLNSGQVCCTATRWIIHDDIYERFLDLVASKLKQVRIGYGLNATTDMGPVVSERQRKRILGYLERGVESGATAILPGGPADPADYGGGFYVKPSLLQGSVENVCAVEEIFGPVAFLMRFHNEKEGVECVNHSSYGLANSVWTSDLTRAHRVAESMIAGNSWINAHNIFKHGIPYGGVNLSGLGGGVLGPDTFLDYLRPKSVVRPV